MCLCWLRKGRASDGVKGRVKGARDEGFRIGTAEGDVRWSVDDEVRVVREKHITTTILKNYWKYVRKRRTDNIDPVYNLIETDAFTAKLRMPLGSLLERYVSRCKKSILKNLKILSTP